MLKIDRTGKAFHRLENPTLTQASILERSDLQEYIWNSPAQFFAELGEELFLIDKEACPTETVGDRIDILAVDAEGRVVIVELKRGNNKFQLLQAIAYAGMVSKWTADDLIARAGSRADDLRDFVQEDLLNRSQRILLIAEAYDYEVLAGAEWLYEQYGVEIACARVTLAVDALTGHEYLSCTQVFPPRELAEQAVTRSRRAVTVQSADIPTWEDYLGTLRNESVVAFVREQLTASCERNDRQKHFYYRLSGRRRWQVEIYRPCGTVWQQGRFAGDVAWWKERLSDPDVEPKGHGKQVRFFLKTPQDFTAFLAASQELAAADWQTGPLAMEAIA